MHTSSRQNDSRVGNSFKWCHGLGELEQLVSPNCSSCRVFLMDGGLFAGVDFVVETTSLELGLQTASVKLGLFVSASVKLGLFVSASVKLDLFVLWWLGIVGKMGVKEELTFVRVFLVYISQCDPAAPCLFCCLDKQ